MSSFDESVKKIASGTLVVILFVGGVVLKGYSRYERRQRWREQREAAAMEKESEMDALSYLQSRPRSNTSSHKPPSPEPRVVASASTTPPDPETTDGIAAFFKSLEQQIPTSPSFGSRNTASAGAPVGSSSQARSSTGGNKPTLADYVQQREARDRSSGDSSNSSSSDSEVFGANPGRSSSTTTQEDSSAGGGKKVVGFGVTTEE